MLQQIQEKTRTLTRPAIVEYLFEDMPFLCPRQHKASQIEEKTRCYNFEKDTVFKFIAQNPANSVH